MEDQKDESEKVGEYLLIFVTILLSFSAYEYVKVFMFIIKSKSYECLIQPPFLLILSFFVILVEYWWDSFREIYTISKNISWFFLVLLQPIIFYLVATLLTPEFAKLSDFSNKFNSNFFENRIPVYILGILLIIAFTILSQDYRLKAVNLFRFIFALLGVVGIIWSSLIIQYVICSSILVLTILFIIALCWDFFNPKET
jgi:hypothetical protein